MIEIVRVYGHSGAERSLIKSARGFGFHSLCFNDISKEEKNIKDSYAVGYPKELYNVEAEIIFIDAEISKLEKTIESKSLEIKFHFCLLVKNLEEEIDEQRNIRFRLGSLFSYLRAKFTLTNKERLLHNLRLDEHKEIDKLLTKEYTDLQSLTNRRTYLKSNKNNEVEKRMNRLREKIEDMDRIKNSSEYSGVIGELAAIENLKSLPDDYYLLNDVHLELDKYIKFDDSELKSAQIDHVVVGPTGVYVIETKNWSAQYTLKVYSENHFTPHDQIRRGNYLLYKYLNDSTKIKSIIAVHGADIPHREEYTRVIRTNELSHHIRKGYKVLTPEDVNEIAGLLIPLVNLQIENVPQETSRKIYDANFNRKRQENIQNVRFNDRYCSLDDRMDRAEWEMERSERQMDRSEKQMEMADRRMERADRQMERADREWGTPYRKRKRFDKF